jgi:hypothetical protein
MPLDASQLKIDRQISRSPVEWSCKTDYAARLDAISLTILLDSTRLNSLVLLSRVVESSRAV